MKKPTSKKIYFASSVQKKEKKRKNEDKKTSLGFVREN
jgi:hypothetical protein